MLIMLNTIISDFGAFIAKVILNNENVGVNFPDFILKMMMGKKANFHDLEQIQPNLFSSLRDMEID